MDEDRGATRLIPLTRGLHTTVDADDYERLARHRWHAVPRSNGHGFYAARSAGSGGRIWMHREIAAPPSARIKVDHRNGDGLDNRRANLRAATSQQNNWNRRLPGQQGYRGVRKTPRGWAARIHDANGRVLMLGMFASAGLAAKAYDAAARAMRGEFAVLNFPAVRDEIALQDRLSFHEAAAELAEEPARFRKTYVAWAEDQGFPRPFHLPGGGLCWSRTQVHEWKLAQEQLMLARLTSARLRGRAT
ncbi:HNH endonuclease [Phenylobacterium sp. SCN 70-31]|uniref:HNH endonuclease n=1 Tax=Phenylobacterium sp. SCN 70-31 TaxID=1660129 RepID=UPI00086E9A81|nr:HNH endonuclease [Phenylobacterium sp. SCN 70-31]ODT83925.1 MAG: hypothetical protein ABS78_23010 [Phenylobacterium sp. SCN 70-31]